MASSLISTCRFNPVAGGTTDWTYSTAVAGYSSPALAGAVNAAVYSYRAESNDLSQWEEGIGAYSSGTGVFARTTVLYNSSGTGTGPGQSGAGTKITFSTVPQVAIVALAEDLLAFNAAMSLTTAQQDQGRKNLGEFSGGGYANIVATGVSSTISIAADAVALFNVSGNMFGATSVALSLVVSGGGANGLDAGTIGTNQYHYFMIYNPATGTVASLASLSATAPTMPSGYTYKRRIGWFNYSGGITQFIQRNSHFNWINGRTVASGTQAVSAQFSLSGLCSPVASRVFGYLVMNNNTVALQDNQGNIINQVSGIATQCFFHWSFVVQNGTYQMGYLSSSAGGQCSIMGWEDNI